MYTSVLHLAGLYSSSVLNVFRKSLAQI